jgi:hypothetical protein
MHDQRRRAQEAVACRFDPLDLADVLQEDFVGLGGRNADQTQICQRVSFTTERDRPSRPQQAFPGEWNFHGAVTAG